MKSMYWQFSPLVVLSAGSLLISGVRQQHSVLPQRPLSTMPRQLLGLQGRDVVVSKEEQRVAGMSEYAMREYGSETEPAFSTYVGYYNRQIQGQTIHSPKNCLPGAGWETLAASRVPLAGSPTGGTVNRTLLSNKGTLALVYYWYQGRGREESSEYKVKWDLLRDAALYGRTEEALVRIVIPIVGVAADSDKAKQDAKIAEASALAERVARDLRAQAAEIIPTWTHGS